MRHRTELADRLRINELAKAGQTDQQIAEVVGFSRWTVRKWRCRYRDQVWSGKPTGAAPTGQLEQLSGLSSSHGADLASSASRLGGQDLAG